MLNIHATALIVGDRGLLVLGPSGSGKTTLALTLIDHFSPRGKFSRIVGDDQLFVEVRGGRLLVLAPDTIAGLVEVPGLGPCARPFEPAAVIDMAIRLVPADRLERMQERTDEIVAGCRLPLVKVPERNAIAAVQAVAAELDHLPFGAG